MHLRWFALRERIVRSLLSKSSNENWNAWRKLGIKRVAVARTCCCLLIVNNNKGEKRNNRGGLFLCFYFDDMCLWIFLCVCVYSVCVFFIFLVTFSFSKTRFFFTSCLFMHEENSVEYLSVCCLDFRRG